MFRDAYFGYNGSPRALAVLLLHTAVLFLFGTGLFLAGLTVVLWATAGLVLLFVPMNLMQMWDELRDPGEAPERRKSIVKTLLFEFSLLLPYVVMPGFLLSYPISDQGFRLLYGNRLQASTTKFLNLPPSKVRTRPGVFATFVEYKTLPPDIQSALPVRPEMITIGGTTLRDRHLEFVYGGGFGHWGLMVGPPTLTLDPAESKRPARRMWPGVYCFAGE
jgi:hypothetical protein